MKLGTFVVCKGEYNASMDRGDDLRSAKKSLTAGCGTLVTHWMICGAAAWFILSFAGLGGVLWFTLWIVIWAVLCAVLWIPMALIASLIIPESWT